VIRRSPVELSELNEASPFIIWSHPSPGNNLPGADDSVGIAILKELGETEYLQTSLQTISTALGISTNIVRERVIDMFNKGYFRQITVYQEGKSWVRMFDPDDKHPRFTQTELRAFQKAPPKWTVNK